MSAEILFYGKKLSFSVSGPAITKQEIESVVWPKFHGYDEFVEFYEAVNGGPLTKTMLFNRKSFSTITSSDVDRIYVEALLSISEEKIKTQAEISSAPRIRRQRSSFSDSASKFTNTHFPFARDVADNELWIDLSNGNINYVAWDSIGEASDVMFIAPSFREFICNLEELSS